MRALKEILANSQNHFSGIPAAPGLVIGTAYLYLKEVLSVTDDDVENIEEAIVNFREAVAKAKKELDKIFLVAQDTMGEDRAKIFQAQLLILDDEILLNSIEQFVRTEKKLPEYIVHREMTKYIDLLASSSDAYFRERATDIEDIKNRIIRNLQRKRLQSKITPGVIVVSELLTPADTLLFSRWDVKAYVTDRGGLTSHTAILARALDIPAIVGCHNATHQIHQDDTLIVDGFHGLVFVNPDERQMQYFAEKIDDMRRVNAQMKELKEKASETLDGRKIRLFANVDVLDEINLVIGNKAEGIGLYRTEQLIAENAVVPDENEQKEIYENIARKINPLVTTIRAFDIGGDKVKVVDFPEANPFLGLRGVRFLLENPSIYKKQIRAALRANSAGNIHFMIPMVATVEEITRTKELIAECVNELQSGGIPCYPNMKLGIMIEVPSAALLIKDLAHEVDFFSIGTNDLIQYLLAVDRGNDAVAELYQEFHPSVLRTLEHIIRLSDEAEIPVSLCGEMAADNLALPILIGLGLRSLSASPAALLSLKRTIRSVSYEHCRKLAAECLAMRSSSQVAEHINAFFEEHQIPRTRTILHFD